MKKIKLRWIIITIIGIIVMIIPSMIKNKDTRKESSNIEEIINAVNYDVILPDAVKSYNGKIIKASVDRNILEIDSEDFIFKAAPYVSFNVSVLGMYDDSKEDNKYFNKDTESNIIFIRIRRGYKGLEHCTIVDYGNYEVMHGYVTSSIKSDKDILEDFGISNVESTDTENIIIRENDLEGQ